MEGHDKECGETRARGTAGIAVGGQSIVALPDATHEFGVSAEPERVWRVSISAVRSVITITLGRTLA